MIGKLKDRYFIKIVPHRGDAIHRFEVTKRHIVGGVAALALAIFGALGVHVVQLYEAHAQVRALQNLTTAQRAQLQAIDDQARQIRSQLQRMQKQNLQIQQLIGVKTNEPAPPRHREKTSRIDEHTGFGRDAASLERRLSALGDASTTTLAQTNALHRLTLRILNLRRVEAMARERMIAAIPSIDPVDGAPVIGCYCYRSAPDAEFHPGVDLGADYGETVRAAAAGVVSSAQYDGGYGLKVDIDHGNGYHTWYAHLSSAGVSAGESVVKGQPIGLVGSTGFSTGPHLHYQIMLDGAPIDPTPYLDGVPPKVLASLP
ncbi:MAG: peptidoglycan DD-metalloendopeptidase family protein [Candidatus Eremiobacteraeota bacterium]|nr:peptidoglycan DD-metalloendopeptidase family protein [Candidatus Eremiobacteraeota bacterium]